MAYKILDVSYYQQDIYYKAAAKDVDGVILRIGITYWGAQNMGKDTAFDKHYAGFKAVGCPVGVYYYSAADSVEMAKKEADYCLSLMAGRQFELPVYYDVENNQRQGGLSKELLTQIVDAFCSKVEKAGYYVGFYASTSWLLNKMDTPYLASKYTLWKADYRTAYDKTIPCDMHQYTSQGKVAGINGNVDLSNASVNFEAIIKGKGLNGFPKIEITEEEKRKSARLIIGYLSKGDMLTMSNFLDSLKIKFEATTEGYIITKHEVSGGDIVAIEGKAEDIGNISVKEYKPDTAHPEQCAECDLLTAKIAQLEMDFAAEVEFKRSWQEKAEKAEAEAEELAGLYGKVSGELSRANSALAAERGSNQLYTTENAQLKDKLNKIKEIVGG